MKKLAAFIATAILGVSGAAIAQPVAYDRHDRDHDGDRDRDRDRHRHHDDDDATVARWETLSSSMRDRGNIQVVPIGAENGRFEAVRLQVDSGRIFVKALAVVFADGTSRNVHIGRTLRAGQHVDLDLPGSHRAIQRVQVSTDAVRRRRAPGTFSVLAAREVNVPQYGSQDYWPRSRR